MCGDAGGGGGGDDDAEMEGKQIKNGEKMTGLEIGDTSE